MKKYIFLTLASILFSVASFAIGPIMGDAGVCVGATNGLSDSIGGTWTSSNTSIVTIGYTTGVTFGVNPGTATITYKVGASTATMLYTVTTPPAPITGILSECVGGSQILSDATPGGTWSTSDYLILSIGHITGIDTGWSAGIVTVYYTIAPGCSATVLDTVIVTPTPDSVHGPSGVCMGSTITMTDATPGGIWTSSNTSVATIGSLSGIVTPVGAGNTVINYAVTGTCGTAYAPIGFVTVYSGVTAGTISGASTVCVSSSITLSDAATGGVWTSSNTGVATVVSFSGVVTGASPGTAVISYTVTNPCGTAHATYTVTVNPGITVGAITGTASVCVGATTTLSDATSGGTWSSSSSSIATVGSTGIVTGNTAGAATISYTITGPCGSTYATYGVTVMVTIPPATITGPTSVCVGSTITLSDATPGGTWSAIGPKVTITGSGVVTGISTGTAVITYQISGVCGSAWTWDTITVISTVSPGTITGSSTVMATLTSPLSETVSGGVWSSSNTSVATIDPATGVVTGVTAGVTTITYTVTGCGGSVDTTFADTVTAVNIIAGNVNFTGVGYTGFVKVWLITYDLPTHILTAVDSVEVFSTGSTAYYQFLGKPTDSFRIKAYPDSAIGTYGYIPTYHNSDFYWYTATVLPHVSGTSDLGQDINMLYGLIIPGPGFIAGDVTLGANKETSGSLPAVGLRLYCINAATGRIVQQTTTDDLGHYSFSGLEVSSSYYVHPEAGGYISTDYPIITLTTLGDSQSNASFIQHTVSHTITPSGTTGVSNLKSANTTVAVYPNPANGKLNIHWLQQANEHANVIISDVTGREVLKTSIDMNGGSGTDLIDVSGLTNGLYLISVKSASVNYNNKIQIQH